MSDGNAIRVALLGMDARSKGLLRLYIGMLSRQRCEVVEADAAEVAVIDFDTADALHTLADVQRTRPQAAILGLSYGTSVPEGLKRLDKPVRGPELLAAIYSLAAADRTPDPAGQPETARAEGVRAAHAAASVADARPAPPPAVATVNNMVATARDERLARTATREARPAAPAAAAPVAPGPVVTRAARALDTGLAQTAMSGRYGDRFHLHTVTTSADPDAAFEVDCGPIKLVRRVLLQVLADGQPREITHSLMPADVIQFHPLRGGLATTSLSDGRLRSLCISALSMAPDQVVVRPCATLEPGRLPDGTITAEAMLWKLTLWCGRGRRPDIIADDAPVSIARWPNLTRLLPVEHAARICALLVAAPRSMVDTARDLGIELSTVHAFCGAAHAIGVLKIHAGGATANSPAPVSRPRDVPAEGARHGLFGRILKHIFR